MRAFEVIPGSGLPERGKAFNDLWEIYTQNKWLFEQDIVEGKIRPFMEEEEWYMGPHRQVMWNNDIYLLSEVRKRMESGKKVWYLGTKRKEAVKEYILQLNS